MLITKSSIFEIPILAMYNHNDSIKYNSMSKNVFNKMVK